jgi:DNA polymerase-3 subunit gamma/tau
MFGEAGPAPRAAYQVLARKYRPRRFEDLIGQEAMVRTLTQAFATGRIAHAFMLTGVRGVGKTTTARLLARGLNYASPGTDRPSVVLDPAGEHCRAIMESRHPDVLELDAASRTGVGDMRDLLDGVRYAPVSARYKVYIIDEVHMLSNAAFNALLKTLEEPPPHVKFIFATTEIRKVPVTVLSRCQRFDLKRLEAEVLAAHLGRVAAQEGASVDLEGLHLIARAAEGSVRDGLSILDQAIVQVEPGETVSLSQVRDMLGLADRGRLMDAYEAMLSGDAARALGETGEQVRGGADPLVVLKEFLDITADASRALALGQGFAAPGPVDWNRRLGAVGQRIGAAGLARVWRVLLTGYQDAQTAPDVATAMEMVVLRLSAMADLPSPEEAARMLMQGGGAGNAAARGGAGEAVGGAGGGPAAALRLSSLSDMLDLIKARREVALAYDVETFLRVESFRQGEIAAGLAPNAPGDLMIRLQGFLSQETGADWAVRPAREPVASLRESAQAAEADRFAQAARDPGVAAVLAAFAGAQIVAVEPIAPGLEPGDPAGNVVAIESRRRRAGQN